jgi:hypothetical protein
LCLGTRFESQFYLVFEANALIQDEPPPRICTFHTTKNITALYKKDRQASMHKHANRVVDRETWTGLKLASQLKKSTPRMT